MAAPRAIGSLFIDITARTAQLEADMGKVKSQVDKLKSGLEGGSDSAKKLSDQFDKLGTQAGMGLGKAIIGTEVLSRVHREILMVMANSDKIKGVPPEVIGSIQLMNNSFRDARTEMDVFIANGLAGFANFGRAMGVQAAMWANSISGFNKPAIASDFSGLGDNRNKEQRASDEDPDYDNKRTAALTRLHEMQQRQNEALLVESQRIDALRERAQRYYQFAEATNTTALAGTLARIKGTELEIDANTRLTAMNKQYDQSVDRLGDASAKLARQHTNLRDVEKGLLQTQGEIMVRMGNMSKLDRTNAASVNEWTQAVKDLTDNYQRLGPVQAKLQAPFEVMRDSFVSGFSEMSGVLTEFITGGETNFQAFLARLAKSIIQTFIQLAVISPILNSMFPGMTAMPALYSFKARGGPFLNNEPFVAGENGPELVMPSASGSVMTAGATARLLGSSSGGATYNIDARGADQGQIMRLERKLVAMQGSIHRQSVGAVLNSKRRGGTSGNSL